MTRIGRSSSRGRLNVEVVLTIFLGVWLISASSISAEPETVKGLHLAKKRTSPANNNGYGKAEASATQPPRPAAGTLPPRPQSQPKGRYGWMSQRNGLLQQQKGHRKSMFAHISQGFGSQHKGQRAFGSLVRPQRLKANFPQPNPYPYYLQQQRPNTISQPLYQQQQIPHQVQGPPASTVKQVPVSSLTTSTTTTTKAPVVTTTTVLRSSSSKAIIKEEERKVDKKSEEIPIKSSNEPEEDETDDQDQSKAKKAEHHRNPVASPLFDANFLGQDRRKTIVGIFIGVAFVCVFVAVILGLVALNTSVCGWRMTFGDEGFPRLKSPNSEDMTPPELRGSGKGSSMRHNRNGSYASSTSSNGGSSGGARRKSSPGQPFFGGKLILHDAPGSSKLSNNNNSKAPALGNPLMSSLNLMPTTQQAVLMPSPAEQVTDDLISPKYDDDVTPTDEDDEESDDTVYECPGLAATAINMSEMVVRNPFYLKGNNKNAANAATTPTTAGANDANSNVISGSPSATDLLTPTTSACHTPNNVAPLESNSYPEIGDNNGVKAESVGGITRPLSSQRNMFNFGVKGCN